MSYIEQSQIDHGDSPQSDGLIFVGVEPGCGKTTVMTGLAAVMNDYGACVRAIKPVGIGPHARDSAEMSFMSIISKTAIDYPLLSLKFPPVILDSEWKELILTGTRADCFTFIELPGICSTPISFPRDAGGGLSHSHVTIANLIKAYNLPCVLSASYSIDALERIELSLSYLKEFKIEVSAIVTVETNRQMGLALDERMYAHDFELILGNRYGLPYLGKLSHSSAISVQSVSQGNLKKCIEQDLDLLALRRFVQLPVM